MSSHSHPARSDSSPPSPPRSGRTGRKTTSPRPKNFGKKRVFSGIGLSPAVAVGRLRARHPGEAEVPRYRVSKTKVAAEVERLESALAQVRADLDALRAHARGMPGAAEIGAFIGLYRAMLDDPEIATKPRDAVRARRCNAEWALQESADAIRENFRRIEDPYLRERGKDIAHVVRRVMDAMKLRSSHPPGSGGGGGSGTTPASARGEVLVAHDLSPAEVVEIVRAGCAGFVTEAGGATSHTAILARGMGVAAVAGIADALSALPFGERALVDGGRGELVLNPSPAVLRERVAAAKKVRPAHPAHSRKRPRRARTRDGVEVSLEANMEFPDETDAALAAGADGVGLFRTEFLFLNRDDLPGEEEQFEIYREVVSRMAPRPVTFRTLDIGADKIPAGGELAEAHSGEANPALGVRAIRQCLAAPEMFLTQLRAMLRAAATAGNSGGTASGGSAKILLPMVSHPGEMAQAEILLDHAAEQLRASGRTVGTGMGMVRTGTVATGSGSVRTGTVGGGTGTVAPGGTVGSGKGGVGVGVGVMIEVPASVFIMRDLSRRASFFSIGTNDLIQYVMASDRGEEKLAALHDPLHPAVLRLTAEAVEGARRSRRPVTLCGEMAGEPHLTRLMLCLGMTRLSMNAAQIPAVREEVERTDLGKISPFARRILKAETPATAAEILREINRAG